MYIRSVVTLAFIPTKASRTVQDRQRITGAIFGVHPRNVAEWNNDLKEHLEKIFRGEVSTYFFIPIGVGESGLDDERYIFRSGHKLQEVYRGADLARQAEVMKEHALLANQFDLTLVLHVRCRGGIPGEKNPRLRIASDPMERRALGALTDQKNVSRVA
jgi:Tat protein secretion system quality control protein TatD with DNase activity